MKFDEAYDKVLKGTATEEEKEFVREQVRKAEQIENLMKAENRAPVTVPADTATIKKARKQMTVKGAGLVLLIVVVALLVVAGAVCGGIFGTAVSSAKKAETIDNVYAEALAETAAVGYIENNRGSVVVDTLITDFDKDLEINASRLRDSIYVYYIDVHIMTDDGRIYDIEVAVNSGTGHAQVVDFDME